MNLLIKLIGLSMLISSSIQISTPDSLTYVAGVVEYLFNQSEPTPETYKLNTDKYIDIIKSADAVNVDIIVFPESSLNTVLTPVTVPRETEDINICKSKSYDDNLRRLACAARKARKYVVINLVMKINCIEDQKLYDDHEHECRSQWMLYNTDVVFDRDGKVISTYRKYNVFAEPGKFQSKSRDIRTFTTDFNVTFGHFDCSDLLCQASALVDHGVKDIIFTTMWISELPFLSAVQIQQSWAHSNDVNFLVAGTNQPELGSSGSGIFSGKSGALTSTINGDQTTVLLVHEVPKVPGNWVSRTAPGYITYRLDKLKWKRDPSLDAHNLKIIQPPESAAAPRNDTFTLCQNSNDDELCCDFKIDVSQNPVPVKSVTYTFYAGVFNGVRRYDDKCDINIRTCAIFACLNDSISSCGIRFNDTEYIENNISFDNIVISGFFPKNDVSTLPSSLDYYISPYPTTDFSYDEDFSEESARKEITTSLLTPKIDLFTFGIYGRDFRSSSEKVTSTIARDHSEF